LEERSAAYAVPVPGSLDGSQIKVRVRLLFRPFPPHALRDLGLGELVGKLPTWEMDSFESNPIPVQKNVPRRTEYKVPDDFASLDGALDGLLEGDRLFVAPGRYELTKPLVFEKGIQVKSLEGPEVTTLKFTGDHQGKESSVVIFRHVTGAAIEGFTITGG